MINRRVAKTVTIEIDGGANSLGFRDCRRVMNGTGAIRVAND
ncbi:MAG: hypothetical protein V9E82_08630 [Candidatus Nanopelagicales bacterium]